MDMISEHFSVKEMSCRCGCGFVDVDEELIEKLEKLREFFNRPIRVSSGCRCEDYNESIGGKPASLHLQGRAVDILITNSIDRFYIVKTAQIHGFKGIGLANNFIHLDIRSGSPRIWLY